jgi:Tol biopolymer transport system component
VVLGCAVCSSAIAASQSTAVGAFESHTDVGAVLKAGDARYDSSKAAYTVSGSGENMWGDKDAFHYVWKKATGDLSLAADVAFAGRGGDPHRKAGLIIRQSLDADSAYADAVVHGDGLASLQFRNSKGDQTGEVQSNVKSPRRLRIEKRGKYVSMSVTAGDEALRPSGAAVRIEFDEPFYIGLAVCAHNKDAYETATFTNVRFAPESSPSADAKPTLYSTLETLSIAASGRDRRVVHVAPGRIEAPNWTPDGRTLLYNRGGRIFRIPVAGGEPEMIDTGFANRCNNDHGVSPDGMMLAISDQSQDRRQSLIYTVPIAGGTPKRVTQAAPSYWHGWSPDGRTLTFCGERNGEFDVYTIPAGGGKESRLTTANGLDDGPEFSPDGRFIYFNSERSGTMQIWRMRSDGAEQEQVTSDDQNNWFPHISPNGRWMVYLSYEKDVVGHPENKDVTIRMMSMADKKVAVLARIFGGQGTINVPSWSPDSRSFAFVSYQLLP